MRYILVSCLAVMLGATLSAASTPAPPMLLKTRVSQVIDGDTIKVWLDDKEETVRYLAVEAPELNEPGGAESRATHVKLLAQEQVWLECDSDADGQLRRDGHRRLLAYAFADETGTRCLNTELVKLGAARVGIREVQDDTPSDAFAVKRLDELVAAQLEAASSRAGWWGQGDPHAASEFIVCFIKFWGRDEVAWLLNRGKDPIDLALAWQLSDQGEANSVLLGQRISDGKRLLPAGAVCRVHTGPRINLPIVPADNQAVDLQWKRARVWNNTGDLATLRDATGVIIYTYAYRASGS